ncbi:MAG: 30S ribosomal protein S13 [Planctomycetes bacterium]|jgi:small subunit ribosomal protein S13|nr:30S ribosomal protein S13 [Planctomycetota bacterium]
MARILGVDIPNEKWIVISLTYLFGIGNAHAKQICVDAKIEPTAKTKTLTDEELARITTVIEKHHVIEGQLRRQISQNIQRLKDINCYRGTRHRKGLPVRGQRTRSNARTRKGPRRTVAGKKSVKAMR